MLPLHQHLCQRVLGLEPQKSGKVHDGIIETDKCTKYAEVAPLV